MFAAVSLVRFLTIKFYTMLIHKTKHDVKNIQVLLRSQFIETGSYKEKSTNSRATLLKKRLWHRCFPVNFVKFCEIEQNTSGRLLLLLKNLRN